MSRSLRLFLLYVLIDGLFFAFRNIMITAEAGKATSAVANESDTGRNILLYIHYLRQIMVAEQKFTASH
jgi:hypothetical protein